MSAVYLALGANTGNREANLRMALRALMRMSRVEAVSSLYDTEPIGPEQPSFYNAACRIETGLEPRPLLRFLQAIEHEIGRRPGGERWGPRPIDIDLLLYEERIVDEPDLTVPHPRMAERPFVLVPLAAIAGDVRHPVAAKTIGELASAAGRTGVKQIAAPGWERLDAGREPVRI